MEYIGTGGNGLDTYQMDPVVVNGNDQDDNLHVDLILPEEIEWTIDPNGGDSSSGGGGGGAGPDTVGSAPNTTARDCAVAAIRNALAKLGIKDDGLILSKLTANLGKYGGDDSMIKLLTEGISTATPAQINAFIQAMITTLGGYVGNNASIGVTTNASAASMAGSIMSSDAGCITLSTSDGGHEVFVSYDAQNQTFTLCNIDGAGHDAVVGLLDFASGTINYNGVSYEIVTSMPAIIII